MLSSYKAVGIFEEWEVSMELFNATIKSPVRSWDAHLFLNQGFGQLGREALLQWAYLSPDLNAALASDIVLYDVSYAIQGDVNRGSLQNGSMSSGSVLAFFARLAGLGCTFQGPPTVAASGPRKQPRLYGFIGNKLNTTLTKTITH